MFYCLRKKKAQTTIEYSTLVIIAIAACLVAGVYFKRGVQGRWRTAVDEMGEQYDPRYTNTDITYSSEARTNTLIYTIQDVATNEIWTFREDDYSQTDSKTGVRRVGAAP